MFLVNSHSCLVTATPLSSRSKFFHQKGHSLSRSYGANLLSSLTRVLSSALGFSPHPPALVWSTVPYNLKLRGFSRKHGIIEFAFPEGKAPHHISELNEGPDLPEPTSYLLRPGYPSPGSTTLLRYPIAIIRGTGILTRFPSATLFSLALGADLP